MAIKFLCAWRNCKQSFSDPMPPGWTYLITFRMTTAIKGVLNFATDKVDRDAVLCPEHAAKLEDLLLPLS
jgi:hypothetical protein